MLEIRHKGMTTTHDIRAAYDNIYSDARILHQDALYKWRLGALNRHRGSRW